MIMNQEQIAYHQNQMKKVNQKSLMNHLEDKVTQQSLMNQSNQESK